MSTIEFFNHYFEQVRKTSQWQTLINTVEGSEWHREANVAVHTSMCIEHYIAETASHRTQREQMLTLMALLFHDFGKPESEETLERKDGSGTSYHRYAGHEPISANEFISFMCEHQSLTEEFFAQGYDWNDVRKIKVIIEHHLPYGLKNPTKVENFKRMMAYTLDADIQCFYDQLWSDCNGRISDNHEEKRERTREWIQWFDALPLKPLGDSPDEKVMFVLQGPVGAGKSTFTKAMIETADCPVIVISEDAYRLEFFAMKVGDDVVIDSKQYYADAWQYCFANSKEYDAYANAQLKKAVESGALLILDRTNQTRKSRSKWIQAAKQHGYSIESIEIYVSEKTSLDRQKTRDDKDVPRHRAHQIYMAVESCWFPTEVDSVRIISPF